MQENTSSKTKALEKNVKEDKLTDESKFDESGNGGACETNPINGATFVESVVKRRCMFERISIGGD